MPRFAAYACLSLAMATVGSTVVAGKLVAGVLPPFSATALRFALALPCFLAIMAMLRTPWPRLAPRGWLLLIGQAGAGSVGYTTLMIAGLSHASAADAGVVLGTLPVVAALLSVTVLGERPGPWLWLAVALAAGGVMAVAGAGEGRSWLGIGLLLGAVLCESGFILLQKRLAVPVPALPMATLMTAFGLTLSLPVALVEAAWLGPVAATALWAVAFYALVPTVGGFLLWYAGAARVSGAEASVFTAVAPVSAVLLAALILAEPVGLRQAAGVACVLAAIGFLVWRGVRRTAALA
jgi:drug/metabolite transporter (DMT)-like permease